MECLKFGTVHRTDKEGKTYNIGEFALDLQCQWRLTNEDEIIVGSEDLYEPAVGTTATDEDFNWEEFNANLRDIKLNKLISENELSIVSAVVDKFGGLEIQLGNNIKLAVFPTISSKTEIEYWRLIDFRNEKSKHLVSWSTGYEVEQ
jgi:hypothetical protein